MPIDPIADQNCVRRFLLDEADDARVATVRLTQALGAMLDHQAMPTPVFSLCGELAAAACLLADMLKFKGEMIIQLKGDGPVSLLVADCNSEGQVRATAQWSTLDDSISFQDLVGAGYLAVTADPEHGERYQGIVPLDGSSLADCLNHYFASSEQLDTRIYLAADTQQAGGLLLQRLPREAHSNRQEDTWDTLHILADTVGSDELKTLAGPPLAYRLFHGQTIRRLDPWPVQFGCSCSRDRSARALRSLGKSDVESLFASQSTVTVDCHFCGQVYQYDQADIEWLLSDQPPGPDTLQ